MKKLVFKYTNAITAPKPTKPWITRVMLKLKPIMPYFFLGVLYVFLCGVYVQIMS